MATTRAVDPRAEVSATVGPSTEPTRESRRGGIPPGRAWAITVTLGLLYVFSFADRFVLALLVAPIRQQFGISDLAVSLLYGPAFAIFYAVLGFPAGRLADQGNRRRMIVIGVAIWGTSTILSAFASQYWMLVVLRSGLALGEAALTPAAYSMIADMFPPDRRRRAAGLYTAMGSLGSSGSFVLGAFVLSFTGTDAGAAVHGIPAWQLPFIALGVPTLVIGVVFLLLSREPVRLSTQRRPALSEAVAHVTGHARLYLGLFVGGALAGTMTLAAKSWSTEVLRRGFGLTIQQAGYGIGFTCLLATFVGSLLLPMLTERLERSGRPDATLVVSIVGVAAGTACSIGLAFASSVPVYLALLGTGSLLLFGTSSNVLVALQKIAPDRLRGVLVALALAIVMLVGLGFGPPIVAIVSHALSPTGDRLADAIAITAAVEGLVAMLLFLSARRPWLAAAEATEGVA